MIRDRGNYTTNITNLLIFELLIDILFYIYNFITYSIWIKIVLNHCTILLVISDQQEARGRFREFMVRNSRSLAEAASQMHS